MAIFSKKKYIIPAFTLVELLVVVGIFVFIALATVANYQSNNRQSQLTMATQALASNIKLTQSYALGSQKFISPSDPGHDGEIPAGGWGVHLSQDNPTIYQIVADFNDNHVWNSDSDGLFKTITLPEKITVDDILYNSSYINDLDIFFQPPDPKTFLNGNQSGNVTITLYDDVLATTSEVTVNFFGLVEIN